MIATVPCFWNSSESWQPGVKCIPALIIPSDFPQDDSYPARNDTRRTGQRGELEIPAQIGQLLDLRCQHGRFGGVLSAATDRAVRRFKEATTAISP